MTAPVELAQFTQVTFYRFKAFRAFSLKLRHFNILVGPNNAGKSTILTAFRILAAAMRKASTRKPTIVQGPHGQSHGYSVDLKGISVAEENIFYNYVQEEAAYVRFILSNKNSMLLYFPEQGECSLILETNKKSITSPTGFRSQFKCPIGFVPILGPVDHDERLYDKEAARLALFNYRAARNFRNIWHHYPEKFDEFRLMLMRTWPGMDIERPQLDTSDTKPYLHMFCPEERILREIFWSGFGFQVWCQMLTHIIQSKDSSIFLIDEPDIYLHADLQRQLLGLLRNLGPDILIATHSAELISEAEADEIVLISKKRSNGSRIRDPAQLMGIFRLLGSNLNPILTQLGKTKRALFVEGKDFQIFSRFASRLNYPRVANRGDFAVVTADGFNVERIRSLKQGMETTLGSKVRAAAIFDRDYRSDEECKAIADECREFCDRTVVHMRKEVENYLLVPMAIDRAARKRLADVAKRSGRTLKYNCDVAAILDDFANEKKAYVASQYLAERRRFERKNSPGTAEATINESALKAFEVNWADPDLRLSMIPGKEALSAVNRSLQEQHKISVTPTAIIDAMKLEEVPDEMKKLIESISDFCHLTVE